MKDKYPLKLVPINQINWFFMMPNGVSVVMEAYDKKCKYHATTHATISRNKVISALKAHKKVIKP